jgi:hypothetical protein
LLHPELGLGVEWRFVLVRAYNAEIAVSAATRMLWDPADNGKPTNIQILKYMEALRKRLTELLPPANLSATPESSPSGTSVPDASMRFPYCSGA